jgi:hypothetical protein
MKTYQSIQQDHDDESSEGDALINRPTPIPDRSPSHKRYLLAGGVALGFLLAYNLLGTTQNNAPNNADVVVVSNNELMDSAQNDIDAFPFLPECFNQDDDQCGDQFCCPTTRVGVFGYCAECCDGSDCISVQEQPPAGEIGKRFCVDNKCETYANGESSQIPSDGNYPVWSTSETIDNSKTFYEINMPRTVYDGPLLEQVWHIDLNEQEASFDKNKVIFDGTHITIPSFEPMHAAYSRSYNFYDEHETGIVTLTMQDNPNSMVADYAALAFVEKYHTLTYDGIIDTSRGDFIKAKAKEQLREQPEFDRGNFVAHYYPFVFWASFKDFVMRQIEGGLDHAIAWQIRRYVNSYPKDYVGLVNPSSSASWASHSEKAKQAINLAKDPSFERDYLKSELHCKHIEKSDGVSFTQDSVTFPVGRPLTIFSGEMINSPVHYFGLGVGHVTADYDPSTGILEIFFQTFAHSRQHADVGFPGPYPNGLWVSPVADGSDYAVDPDRDGRTDEHFTADRPEQSPIVKAGPAEADFTLWARPTEEVCSPLYVDGFLSDFWESINIDPKKHFWEELGGNIDFMKGLVGGMPCSPWMHTDYDGGHLFDLNELGVWGHALGEIRSDKTKEMLLYSPFWDNYKCFYAGVC